MAPSTTGRCGPKGGPIGPFTGGSNGSIRAHISSVNTAGRDMHPRSRLQHAQLVRHALAALDELGAGGQVDWSRAICDRASVRAKIGGPLTGANPVDRGKPGSKIHVLSD